MRRMVLNDAFEALLPSTAPAVRSRLHYASDPLAKSFNNRLSGETRRELEEILEEAIQSLPVAAPKVRNRVEKVVVQSDHRTFRPAEREIKCERKILPRDTFELKTGRGDEVEFCTPARYKHRTFKALEWNSDRGEIRPLLLADEGQAFSSQATKWEKEFCIPIGKKLFIPVVDRKGTIVAWYSNVVYGDKLYTAQSVAPNNASPEKVFYMPNRSDDLKPEWLGLHQLGSGGSGGDNYEVIFDIEGRILQLKWIGGASNPNWGPGGMFMEDALFDEVQLLFGAAALVKSLVVRVGKLGLKMLVRASARQAGKVADDLAGEMAGKLIPLARKREASRVLSGNEMKKFLRKVYDENPHLARLHRAHSLSGEAQHRELLKILEDWEYYTGKAVARVPKGAVEEAKAMGKAGFARNAETGREVLAIEEHVFENTKTLLAEVKHELAYDAVRSANGVPALAAEAEHRWANVLLEWMIEGDPGQVLKFVASMP